MIKRISLPILIGVGLLLGGCKNSESLHTVLEQQVVNNAESYGINASSVVVLQNGEPIYTGHHGVMAVGSQEKVTDNTIYPIYSVAKLFANTLVMQLAEQGKVHLNDPISQYIADLPSAWQSITIAQLLSHASGLPEFYQVKDQAFIGPDSLQAAIDKTKTQPMSFAPNTETEYNQTNYLLIRQLIEQMYHQAYERVVSDQILTPLAMHDTYMKLSEVPKERLVSAYLPNSGDTLKDSTFYFPVYANSVAGIYSSAEDLSQFINAMAQGKLVSQESLLAFWQPHQLESGESYFASGWVIDDAGNWQHVGHDGGASLRVRLLYRDNFDDYFVVVYLTNGNQSGVWSSTLTNSVQQHLLPDLYSRIATWFY